MAIIMMLIFDFITALPIIIIIIAAIKSIKKNKNKRNTYNNNQTKPNIKEKEQKEQNIQNNNDKNETNNKISNIYIKSDLITQYEQKLYNVLNEILEEKNYSNIIILSKVRLADLIKPKTNNYADFNKIKSKHIDFVLCEKQNLNPLLLIELDDFSHNRAERRSRDDFINQSLVQSGYKILHIRRINKENITNILENILTNSMPAVFYV